MVQSIFAFLAARDSELKFIVVQMDLRVILEYDFCYFSDTILRYIQYDKFTM